MAFKQVERNTIDLKKQEVGKSYVGTFAGSKHIKTDLGDQVIWNFTDGDDKPFSMWGFSNLNFQIENVGVGQLVRVTYKGQSKTKNKYGKFAHQSLVEVDDEQSVKDEDDSDVPF